MTRARRLRTVPAVLALAAITALGGCQTDNTLFSSVDSMQGMRADREARQATIAATAIAEGKAAEALVQYEALYDSGKRDEMTVVNYAQLLRKTGDEGKALRIMETYLHPSAKDGYARSVFTRPSPLARSEYAAALIENGNFEDAEDILQDILADEKSEIWHNGARELMGVALDAQGQHREAEDMFRAALDGWKGDPSPVMNNLGLCLASQGRFDTALYTLRQALVLSPDKHAIARNIDIVTALRDKVVRKPPVSLKKKKG